MIGGYYKCDRCKRWVKVFPPALLSLKPFFEILFDDEDEEKITNDELKRAIQVRNSEYAEIQYHNSEISDLNKTYCLCPNCRKDFERFLRNE